MTGQRTSSSTAVMTAVAAAVAAVVLVAPPGVARGQENPPPATGTTTAPAPAVPAAVLSDVNTLLRAVQDPNGLPISRDEAARRLVARQGEPEAALAINTGLISFNHRAGQVGLARALAEAPQPDPQFITGLGAMLKQPDTAEAAAAALLKFPAERPRLLNIARDPNQRDVRASVIRALGAATDRRTLVALAEIATSPNEPVAIRNAAADALASATAQRGTSGVRDIERWRQWLAANRDKPDAQFEADLLAARSSRLERLRTEYDRLANDTRALLAEQYRRMPEAARGDVLVSYLRANAPEARLVGVRIIREAFNAAENPPAAAREQLRALVGDSVAEVRLEVAGLLGILNDAAALEPLLEQVAREPDPNVRAAQAAALGPMSIDDPDLRAVPVLLRLVSDRSAAVAEAAADSLQPLGRQLRERRPREADDAAATLANVLRQPAAQNNDRLREALVDAAAALQSPALFELYRDLLKPNQPPNVRRAAVRAMGALGTTWAANPIFENGLLEDERPELREAAVDALVTSADVTSAERLYERLRPGGESNDVIREKIWNLLSSLFHKDEFRPEDLIPWADRFNINGDPVAQERRLTVLLEVKAKLQKMLPDRARDLAAQQQNIGETHMQLAQPAEAIPELQSALDYYRKAEGEAASTQVLVAQLMKAHLATKNYERAIAFAAQEIARHDPYQTEMGSQIIDEADRLRKAGDLENALALITQAQAIKPPLENPYRDNLKQLETDVRRRVADRAKAPASAVPGSASGSPAADTAGVTSAR